MEVDEDVIESAGVASGTRNNSHTQDQAGKPIIRQA